MSAPALLLLAATIVQLLRTVVRSNGPRRLDRWSWAVLAAVGVWQLWYDGLLIAMVPGYLLAALVFITGRTRVVFRIGLMVLSVPLMAVPVIDAAIVPIDVDDYRSETWSTAFDRLHDTLRANYAFGEWKQVDWDGLYTNHAPLIAAAEQAKDGDAYYRAVRAYVYAIPDGHLSIDGAAHDHVRMAEIGGGYGFTVLRLDDGSVIAGAIEPDGPAAESGMIWGAEITEWDGVPIDDAVSGVSTLWASRPPATTHVTALARHRLLTRAPIGQTRSVTFRNPGERQHTTAVLIARRDGYRSLSTQSPNSGPRDEQPVSHHMRDGGIGYVRIGSLDTGNGRDPVGAMDRAIRAIGDANGLILDVRGNRGGRDDLVPKMMSYFTPDRILYERIAVPAPIGGGTWPVLSLHVEPNELQFTGPVVVLVDHRTKSSGEGFAVIAKQLPNAHVIGLTPTDGSFGIVGGRVRLPTDIDVVYPWGVSIDGDGRVQVDGDHRGRGGVSPDVMVPLTLESAESVYRYGDDVVLDFAARWLEDQQAAEKSSG